MWWRIVYVKQAVLSAHAGEVVLQLALNRSSSAIRQTPRIESGRNQTLASVSG